MKRRYIANVLLPILGVAGVAGAHEFDWLVGCWATPDRSSLEAWVIDSDGSLVGFAVNAKANRVGYYELLTIRETQDGTIVFTAHPAGEATTMFTATEIGESSVVFTNPGHDFPQMIAYSRDGDQLDASISLLDGERKFTFSKVVCETPSGSAE